MVVPEDYSEVEKKNPHYLVVFSQRNYFTQWGT